MKKDIRAFLRRVGSMSFARMGGNIDAIHQETGVSKSFIRLDMLHCALRYGMGYLDYRVFGFAENRDPANRRTYMTMNHNTCLSRKLNDRAAIAEFIDKGKFNQKFRDFIGRDFLILPPENGASALKAFCRGKEAVFAKVTTSFGGQGLEKIQLDAVSDYGALYDRLLSEKKTLVEDALLQNEAMASLCPQSVNTLRMVTVFYGGQAHYVYGLVRMGNGKNAVDNISAGGLYALLNDDGTLSPKAFCDKKSAYYEAHPASGVRFGSFSVPYFAQAKALCLTAAALEQKVGYVGWDVAVTKDGPVLIEGNHLPGYDMCQNHGLNGSRTGILPKFEAIVGTGFFG